MRSIYMALIWVELDAALIPSPSAQITTMLRGLNARNIELPDLRSVELEGEDLGVASPLAVSLDNGKMNQSERLRRNRSTLNLFHLGLT